MKNIKVEDIGRELSLIPIEIIMRDQTPFTNNDNKFNLFVNLHPTDGTRWVLVIRKKRGRTHYFDSFGVETPPLLLEDYVDLGSDERLQEKNESFFGAYCFYLIYLIDKGFRIKSALYNLNIQVKCPDMYYESLCLSCSDINASVNDNVSDKINDNVNDHDHDNDKISDNDKVNYKLNVKDSINDKDYNNDNDSVNISIKD